MIDGQQRLTTLQLFISAFRDFCRENACPDLAGECEKYTLNTGMMADAAVEKYKVWPTLLDRPQFEDVLTAGSRAAVAKSKRARPRSRGGTASSTASISCGSP